MAQWMWLVLAAFVMLSTERLPAWQSDVAIWLNAVGTDPQDPWALTNAAHHTHDNRTIPFLVMVTDLKVPDWMPSEERCPYVVGYQSLADTLRANGYGPLGDRVLLSASKLAPTFFRSDRVVE